MSRYVLKKVIGSDTSCTERGEVELIYSSIMWFAWLYARIATVFID